MVSSSWDNRQSIAAPHLARKRSGPCREKKDRRVAIGVEAATLYDGPNDRVVISISWQPRFQLDITSSRPVALRPRLSTGLPFFSITNIERKLIKLQVHVCDFGVSKLFPVDLINFLLSGSHLCKKMCKLSADSDMFVRVMTTFFMQTLRKKRELACRWYRQQDKEKLRWANFSIHWTKYCTALELYLFAVIGSSRYWPK